MSPRAAWPASASPVNCDEAGEAERQSLAGWIEARGHEHAGDWRMAGYDPPWTIPMLRCNEVLVTLSSCP